MIVIITIIRIAVIRLVIVSVRCIYIYIYIYIYINNCPLMSDSVQATCSSLSQSYLKVISTCPYCNALIRH